MKDFDAQEAIKYKLKSAETTTREKSHMDKNLGITQYRLY